LAFNRTVVLRYRFFLEQNKLAPSTINVRLAAVRRLAYEAADTGLLSPELAAGIHRVKGAKRLGVRVGNWLTTEQSKKLLQSVSAETTRGKRDRAILALLIGCGFRRAELIRLRSQDFQMREEHWVVADLIGKGKHIRTVPVPAWAKRAVDEWTSVAMGDGPIFRKVNRLGKMWGAGIIPKVMWQVVKAAAVKAGIASLAPHDLRRTCACLCHLAGGELEQISISWVMLRSKPPSVISAASRSSGTRLTTLSGWMTPKLVPQPDVLGMWMATPVVGPPRGQVKIDLTTANGDRRSQWQQEILVRRRLCSARRAVSEIQMIDPSVRGAETLFLLVPYRLPT
jgi:site-specific recombinase XerD